MAIACGDPVSTNADDVLSRSYKIHRLGRFTGPVGANSTSSPLLLFGNMLDPATARVCALKTSEAFPGSVVLTQDSAGHTSPVAPSLCTYGYFRAYFVNGTLPAPWTVCPVDAELFRPLLGTPPRREDCRALRRRDYCTPDGRSAVSCAGWFPVGRCKSEMVYRVEW
ncbi:hypothetical protein K438DRAFT_1761767 [Mycena galopus ATCC 62051]|nr:hypothetical protein K438DRAFT_1761767 [Mycena galopus ATCC 62051]